MPASPSALQPVSVTQPKGILRSQPHWRRQKSISCPSCHHKCPTPIYQNLSDVCCGPGPGTEIPPQAAACCSWEKKKAKIKQKTLKPPSQLSFIFTHPQGSQLRSGTEIILSPFCRWRGGSSERPEVTAIIGIQVPGSDTLGGAVQCFVLFCFVSFFRTIPTAYGGGYPG